MVVPEDSRPDSGLVLRRAVVQMVLLRQGMRQPSPSTVALLSERGDFDAGKEVGEMKAADVQFLRDKGLWELLTGPEKEFMTAQMLQVTVSQLRRATSQAEPLCCLLWSLGRSDRILPYDQHSELKDHCDVMSVDLAEALVQQSELRPVEEIVLAHKTAEFWLWRSRMRELQQNGHSESDTKAKGAVDPLKEVIRARAEQAFAEGIAPPPLHDDFPALDKPYRNLSPTEWAQVRSIALERFRALCWLCGLAPDNKWELTPVDVVEVAG